MSHTTRAGTIRDLASAVADRLPPGRGIPLARDLALVAESAPPSPPPVWTDADAIVLAACFAARARRDALAEGSALVTRYFDGVHLVRPGTLSSGVRSQLYASAGEYCNAIGWPQMGARFGTQAALFADTEPLQYRALSVAALGHALNGEYPAAATDLSDAESLFEERGWATGETSYLVLLAEALVASARLDVERLRRAARRMTLVQPDDPYLAFSALALNAMAKMFEGDFGAGRAACRRLLNGSGRYTSHRMVRFFLVCVLSDIMVAQGDHDDALTTLEPFENPEGHGVCFSMQRSAALLRRGRERDLLAETEACVASGADHCLRTLTPILVRRAIAWSRLGSPRRARDTMEAGLLLLVRTGGSATPFLMLPREETRALIEAAVAEHPDLRPMRSRLTAAIEQVGVPDAHAGPASAVVALTPTERNMVSRLGTPLSLSEIARERGVSVNTVKSQVRSIYRKLGVRTRTEAVEQLTGKLR
jgi:DNA-binding CsgD family transcriptional regulator